MKPYNGKAWNALIKELQSIEDNSLHMIGVDDSAMKACRENNERVLLDQSVDPEVGGNTEAYKRILGS